MKVELTKMSFVTCGAHAYELVESAAFEASAIGETFIALVTRVIVVEAFSLLVILMAKAQIDAVREA